MSCKPFPINGKMISHQWENKFPLMGIANAVHFSARNKFKVVNFITATKAKDKKEFNGKRYIKIETDRPI